MSADARWDDLRKRVLSAVLLVVIGIVAVWQGGLIFVELVCAVCGLMVWEATRMFGAKLAVALGVAAAAVMTALHFLSGVFVLPLIIGLAISAASQAGRDQAILFVVVAWIMLGSFALLLLRESAGTVWIIWLVLVVIASDVAGYFAGRMIGGPKFWPKVSPKKTWSGTVAGWVLAGAIGYLFAIYLGTENKLILASMIVGFAGQMGDIAESAVKRRVGVKDSSRLIPGHGGVFDRFDAMLGASVAALGLWLTGLLPGGIVL